MLTVHITNAIIYKLWSRKLLYKSSLVQNYVLVAYFDFLRLLLLLISTFSVSLLKI